MVARKPQPKQVTKQANQRPAAPQGKRSANKATAKATAGKPQPKQKLIPEIELAKTKEIEAAAQGKIRTITKAAELNRLLKLGKKADLGPATTVAARAGRAGSGPVAASKAAARAGGELVAGSELISDQRSNGLHGIVRARAGTGKTFTLVLAVAWIFRQMSIPGFRTNVGGKVRDLTLWELVARNLGFTPIPSPQQQAVWDFIAAPYKVDSSGQVGGPRVQSIRYLAFNSGIVEDFSVQYKWLTNALRSVGIDFSFSTVHSLGNAACRSAYKLKGWGSVNKYRTRDLLSALWQVDLMEVWREKAETINAIEELVGLCKLTNPLGYKTGGWSDDKIQALADHYGILVNGDREKVFQDIRWILDECCRTKTGDRIDFNDQIWLPVVNNLPVDKFDLVLGDEAQDWNRCQQEIILKAGKDSRIIVVGDDRQAIYGFAGADIDSIDRMKGLLSWWGSNGNGGPAPEEIDKVVGLEVDRAGGNAGGALAPSIVPEFPLTVTRRCGRAIVAAVKHLVPDFEAHPDNGEGVVRELDGDQFSDQVQETDMVLCRINAPLVGYAFKLIKAGRRANIVGRDIGGSLKTLIKKSKTGDVSEFLAWLDQYFNREAERLQKRRNPDTEALVTLQDRVECLRMFCDGAVTIKELYGSIDKVFRGKVCPGCNKSFDEKVRECYDCKRPLVKPDGTSFSSIHRAKGLESNRVFILRPDLLPHPMAKTAWAKGQEANLEYVGKTRAKHELIIVNGGINLKGDE